MWRVHRLDRINAQKPANLFDSWSLTLTFRSKLIGRLNSQDVKLRNQAQCLGQGFGTGRGRHPTAGRCAFAMFSGQSFETQESLILGPADFVPKLTLSGKAPGHVGETSKTPRRVPRTATVCLSDCWATR